MLHFIMQAHHKQSCLMSRNSGGHLGRGHSLYWELWQYSARSSALFLEQSFATTTQPPDEGQEHVKFTGYLWYKEKKKKNVHCSSSAPVLPED